MFASVGVKSPLPLICLHTILVHVYILKPAILLPFLTFLLLSFLHFLSFLLHILFLKITDQQLSNYAYFISILDFCDFNLALVVLARDCRVLHINVIYNFIPYYGEFYVCFFKRIRKVQLHRTVITFRTEILPT